MPHLPDATIVQETKALSAGRIRPQLPLWMIRTSIRFRKSRPIGGGFCKPMPIQSEFSSTWLRIQMDIFGSKRPNDSSKGDVVLIWIFLLCTRSDLNEILLPVLNPNWKQHPRFAANFSRSDKQTLTATGKISLLSLWGCRNWQSWYSSLILTSSRLRFQIWLRIPKYWPDRYGQKSLISRKSGRSRLLLDLRFWDHPKSLTQDDPLK